MLQLFNTKVSLFESYQQLQNFFSLGIQLSLFTFSNIENLELVNSQVCELLSKDFGDEFDVICKLLMRLSCLALLGDKYFKCITSQVIRMIPM